MRPWLHFIPLLLTASALAHVPDRKLVSQLDDLHQTLAASYRYDPYGNTTYSSGSLAAANVYRFSSKEVHLNSGLYSYGYRFYSPNWQRWLNRDPMGEEGGLNLYGYVGGDPIRYYDPLGLQWYEPPMQEPYESMDDLLVQAAFLEGFLEGLAQEMFPEEDKGDFVGGTPPMPGGRLLDKALKKAGNLAKKLWDRCFKKKPPVRTDPRNLAEQLALEEAKGGAGSRIMQGQINDPAYPENVWAKMQHVHGDTVVHYWQNLKTGVREGYKFKD